MAGPGQGQAPVPSQPDGSWVGGSAPVGVSQPHGTAPVPRYTPEGSWVGVSTPVGAPGGPPPGYGAPPQYGASTGPYPQQQAGWSSSGPGMAPPQGAYPYAGGPVAAGKGGGWIKWVLIGGAAVIALVVVLYLVGKNTPEKDPKDPTPPPVTTTPKTGPGPTTPPSRTDPDGPVTKPQREVSKPPTTPPTTPPQSPPTTPSGPTGTYAEESSDFGVPPQRTLQSNVGSPTPTSIPVGRLLTTQLLNAEIQKGTDFLLVDVLEGAHQRTIIKARYIPYAGRPGNFTDAVQQQLTKDLAKLTSNRPNFPIVFFCQGVRCWESYNAVVRAYEAGYRNLYWYRGGIAAWSAAGLPMQPLGGNR
jgi:PQQ-dependent catabolism-associated CXXCW motif protein